jgi:hypothetical protein
VTDSIQQAIDLLQRCAATFRHYETEHRNKVPQATQTLLKAHANAGMAQDIETFLATVTDRKAFTREALAQELLDGGAKIVTVIAGDDDADHLNGLVKVLWEQHGLDYYDPKVFDVRRKSDAPAVSDMVMRETSITGVGRLATLESTEGEIEQLVKRIQITGGSIEIRVDPLPTAKPVAHDPDEV